MTKQTLELKLRALLKLGEKFLEEDSYKDAEFVLRKAIKLDPKNPEGHYLLGEALCKQEKFEASVNSLKKANALLPNHPRIEHLLGWATFMNGDANTGRNLLKKSLEKKPDDISTICDLAVLENQQSNTDEAKKYALKAIELEPNNPMAQEVFQVVTFVSKIRSKLEKEVN